MRQRIFKIVVFATAIAAVACSKNAAWREAERRELREEVRAYRDMLYLQNLANEEFDLFSDDVVEAIEVAYPVYTVFEELPSQSDTVQVYVVETIVTQLKDNAHNMRHLFPYHALVEAGILPAGLNRQAQHAFYDCLARKVRNNYPSMEAFLADVMAWSGCSPTVLALQMQCAADLFDWGVEVEETVVAE